ncbi:MAG: M4 family metallopeptidase [Propionibacteriales bacterium]|nr:M4 family metallopeptidase [Propionibacteriales bacterium]
MSTCHFVPPYLLHRIASNAPEPETARCSQHTLGIDERLRDRRAAPPQVIERPAPGELPAASDDAWTVYTANNTTTLPGDPVRSTGDPASGDVAVDEAYAGTEASVELFTTVFSRDSYDGRGAPVTVTVHYERDYDNAFWDGRQLVFGDGDGKVFDRFTKPIDVLAHEFTHGVTQYAAGLAYSNQSGALNESISDVFASMVKQRVRGHSSVEADWLIGEGLFLPSVNGRALRSMSAPGTAYDDPVLGKDPQVATMAEYVETDEDNGGVHINSGIPNRAFHLAALELGGNSWDVAGPIWYSALTSGLGGSTDFGTFAAAAVSAAEPFGPSAVAAVTNAWEMVGVTASSSSSPPSRSSGSAPAIEGFVRVSRSGGFAGLTTSGKVDLSCDPRAPQIFGLLDRIDYASIRRGEPQPDRFVYVFNLPEREFTVHEQALSDELAKLAEIVLRDDT